MAGCADLYLPELAVVLITTWAATFERPAGVSHPPAAAEVHLLTSVVVVQKRHVSTSELWSLAAHLLHVNSHHLVCQLVDESHTVVLEVMAQVAG